MERMYELITVIIGMLATSVRAKVLKAKVVHIFLEDETIELLGAKGGKIGTIKGKDFEKVALMMMEMELDNVELCYPDFIKEKAAKQEEVAKRVDEMDRERDKAKQKEQNKAKQEAALLKKDGRVCRSCGRTSLPIKRDKYNWTYECCGRTFINAAPYKRKAPLSKAVVKTSSPWDILDKVDLKAVVEDKKHKAQNVYFNLFTMVDTFFGVDRTKVARRLRSKLNEENNKLSCQLAHN